MRQRDLLQLFLEKSYLGERRPDSAMTHTQQNPRAQAVKRRWVRDIWTLAGVFMLLNPSLPLMVSTALFTAFLSFSILDETP